MERPVQSWGSLNIKLYTLGGERPTSLRPVGRRLSHVLLSYIMSTGRINRALPYTCLLSTRGIISINESTSTRPGIISFADRRALGSYDRDENGKAETMRPKTFARVLSTCLSMRTLEIDSHSKGRLILFSARLIYALSDTYFITIPKSLSHPVNPLSLFEPNRI